MTDAPLVVGVDVGSQGTCAQALEPDGTLVATSYAAHALSYPRAGWAEQDPGEWTNALVATLSAVREATTQPGFPGADGAPGDAAHDRRAAVQGLEAVTLHRLLGSRPDNRTRFRHHRGNRLPHDVVIVDETSMVSLTMMARLLEAVRPEARLVLVGDADQLDTTERVEHARMVTTHLAEAHETGAQVSHGSTPR